jgi:hypothetical protein
MQPVDIGRQPQLGMAHLHDTAKDVGAERRAAAWCAAAQMTAALAQAHRIGGLSFPHLGTLFWHHWVAHGASVGYLSGDNLPQNNPQAAGGQYTPQQQAAKVGVQCELCNLLSWAPDCSAATRDSPNTDRMCNQGHRTCRCQQTRCTAAL